LPAGTCKICLKTGHTIKSGFNMLPPHMNATHADHHLAVA
jgi:hypothetical protein